jgi:hypothetical protein
MLGLAVLVVGAIYLVVLIVVTRFAYSVAKKQGNSRAKCWLAAAGGFLIVYLPVFWDHIPTVVTHQYYCATEAGFWEYKTVNQWKKENPGVAETLVANKNAPSQRDGDMENYTDTYFLNQRINWVVKRHGKFLFNRWRHEQEVVDTQGNHVLARYVDFSTSQESPQAGWSGWKMWLATEHCSGVGLNGAKLGAYRREFRGVEK